MKLKSLPRRHLHRILALKTTIEPMESELFKLLHIPPSLITMRNRARSKLIPAALRKQIAAAEEARLAAGDEGGSPLLDAHFKRKAAVRGRVKKTAAAGWNKLRRKPGSIGTS